MCVCVGDGIGHSWFVVVVVMVVVVEEVVVGVEVVLEVDRVLVDVEVEVVEMVALSLQILGTQQGLCETKNLNRCRR